MTQAQDDRLDPALRVLIGVILLGGLMGILSSSMTAVGIGTLAGNFHTSLSTIGWVSTGYLLALTVAVPVTAWAGDRFGSKKMWLFGLILFLAASLAAGLAWNVASLITFRVVQGLAAGVLDPLVLTLLARAAGPSRAGRVMGLMGVVLSTGPALGLILGGLLVQSLGWRWLFLVSVPIVIVAFALALRVLPTDQPQAQQARSRLDVLGLVLLGPGLAVLVLALSVAANRATFATWQVLTPLVIGVVLLVGYAIRALRARRTPPLIDLRLFAHRSFAASVTVMALVGVGTYSIFIVLPLYDQQMHGQGPFVAGLLVAPLAVGSAIAMPLAGRLSDRIGSRGLALAGGVVSVLSAVGFTQIGAQTSVVWSAVAAFTIGLGLGFVGAPTMGSLYRTLPGHLVPQGSSMIYMLNQLGASIGIAVITLILQTDGHGTSMQGFHGAYWFATGAALVMLAVSTLLPGRPAPQPTDAAPAADAAVAEQTTAS